jgi:hypothetical protein
VKTYLEGLLRKSTKSNFASGVDAIIAAEFALSIPTTFEFKTKTDIISVSAQQIRACLHFD